MTILDLGDVYMRKFVLEDVPSMIELMQDKETAKHVGNRKIWTASRVYDFIRWNMSHDDDNYYAIIRKCDGAFIGYIGHKKYTYRNNYLYGKDVLTIVIKEKGRGYGKRSVKAYIEYQKKNGIDLYASVDKTNMVSNRLFQSLGYEIQISLIVDGITNNVYFLT